MCNQNICCAVLYLPTNIEVAPADGLPTKEDVSSMEIGFSVILIKSDSMIQTVQRPLRNDITTVQPPLRGGMTAISSAFFKFTVSSRSMYVSFRASIRHDESGCRLQRKSRMVKKFNNPALSTTSVLPMTSKIVWH
jgi:hypothetical protein